jgi:hypothetical protein
MAKTEDSIARINIKVRPRSKKNAITGWHNDRLKIDVAAPPVDGKGNEELIRFLAERAGISRSRVRITMGGASHNKTIEFAGISLETVLQRLQ